MHEKLAGAARRDNELQTYITDKSEANEQYARKDNVRLSGLKYMPEEDNNALSARVVKVLSDNGVVIDQRDIYRLHRSGKPKNDNADVLIRFNNWTARSKVYSLHYIKESPIKAWCDLTKRRQEVLQLARADIKSRNLNAYVYSNAECKLVLKCVHSDKRHYFDTYREFEQLAKLLRVKDAVVGAPAT